MFPYFLLLLAFLADRLSKWWVAGYLNEHGPSQINSYLSLVETYNRGIAFGLFQGIGPIVGWLSVIVVFGMLIYLVRLPKQERMLRAGLALVIGGSLGNLLDRIVDGEVLDFIVTPFRPGIFNVADIAINLGLIIILLALLWSSFRSRLEAPVDAAPLQP